jgi:soluble lytic murein transglycosylase-like protein
MKRLFPQVEALRRGVDRPLDVVRAGAEAAAEAVRRPVDRLASLPWKELGRKAWRNRRQPIMLLIGLGLMAPTGAAMLSARGDRPAAAPPVVVVAKPDDSSTADHNAVAEAWKQSALERQRKEAAHALAGEFRISPTLATQIYEAAENHEIEPKIAFGLVRAESSFRHNVVSHAGAIGYTQLLPSTARWIEPGTTRAELFEPETNLNVGFRYLRFLIDKYDGNVNLALTAYNRGPGSVDRLIRKGRNPDNGYATKVKTGKASKKLIQQNSRRRH